MISRPSPSVNPLVEISEVETSELQFQEDIRPPPAYTPGETRPTYDAEPTWSPPENRNFKRSDKDNIINVELSYPFNNEYPTYEPGDQVHGVLQIQLRATQKITSIQFSARGKSESRVCVRGYCGDIIQKEIWWIINKEKTLWNETNAKKLPMQGGNLCSGTYTFPFSFRIPITGKYFPDHKGRISHSNPPDPVEYSMLPPSCVISFEGRYSRIVYYLKIVVERPKPLSNYKLKVPFLVSPTAPSIRRSKLMEDAVARTVFPPGPQDDPDGWQLTKKDVHLKNLLRRSLGRLSIEVALPKPMTYRIGTPIPFILKVELIESKEDQALLRHIQVNLLRNLTLKSPQRSDQIVESTAYMENIMIGDRQVEPDQVQFHSRDFVKTFRGQLPCTNTPTLETPNIKIDWSFLVHLDVQGGGNELKIEIPIVLTPNVEATTMDPHYLE